MKKSVKIILAISAVVLAGVVYTGYMVYKITNGSEPITGNQEKIPVKVTSLPAITKGEADWTNWRGQAFDGKSQVKGIMTDYSAGLEKLWQINYLCQDKSTAAWSAPVFQGNRLIVPGRD